MRIQQNLFIYNGFSCQVSVSDNTNTTYPSFIKNSKYSKSPTSNFDYSVYLMFTLNIKQLVDNVEEKIYEYFSISFFDMYNFRKIMEELLELLESEFYEEYEHIDSGILKRIKPEFKQPLVITSSTKKFQMGFVPKILYNRKTDEYIPKIKVLINRDDIGVNIPVDTMLAIVYNLININLHEHAINIINACYSSKLYHKKLTQETQKNITIS